MMTLVGYEQAPPWSAYNAEIRTSYRRALPGMWSCLRSACGWHNETVNIWLHVAGALLVIAQMGSNMAPGSRTGWAEQMYLACSFLSFASSALCHTAMCHADPAVCRTCLRADYACLGLYLVGHLLTLVHICFHDQPATEGAYWTGLAAVYGLSLWAGARARKAFEQQTAGARVGMYAVPIVAGVPLLLAHAGWGWGYGSARFRRTMWGVVVGLAFQIPGIVVYAARVPERWFPQTFDVVGSSHQMWHLTCLATVAWQYGALAQRYTY